jgi:hypothetical protein
MLGYFLQDKEALGQQQQRAFEHQTLHTSMAGVDGSLVMVGTTATDGEESDMPKQPEQFVLLEGIPQVSLASIVMRFLVRHISKGRLPKYIEESHKKVLLF